MRTRARPRAAAVLLDAGPAAIEAIFSGALDAAYVGPNPTVNAHSPQLGNTQDVAVRYWLTEKGLTSTVGLTEPVDLTGLYDLRYLNEAAAAGEPEISSP